jgi:hypothetical protein
MTLEQLGEHGEPGQRPGRHRRAQDVDQQAGTRKRSSGSQPPGGLGPVTGAADRSTA